MHMYLYKSWPRNWYTIFGYYNILPKCISPFTIADTGTSILYSGIIVYLRNAYVRVQNQPKKKYTIFRHYSIPPKCIFAFENPTPGPGMWYTQFLYFHYTHDSLRNVLVDCPAAARQLLRNYPILFTIWRRTDATVASTRSLHRQNAAWRNCARRAQLRHASISNISNFWSCNLVRMALEFPKYEPQLVPKCYRICKSAWL